MKLTIYTITISVMCVFLFPGAVQGEIIDFSPAIADVNVVISWDVTKIFTPKIKEFLNNGLTTTFKLGIFLRNTKAYEIQKCRIIAYKVKFDLWDEMYMLTPLLPYLSKNNFTDINSLIVFLGKYDQYPFTKTKNLQFGIDYQIELRVEINHLSEEEIEISKDWLIERLEDSGAASGGFFSSVVEFFVNKDSNNTKASHIFRSELFKINQLSSVKKPEPKEDAATSP